jgi:hypothetical protein
MSAQGKDKGWKDEEGTTLSEWTRGRNFSEKGK